MAVIPVIVGFGGVNAAGRSSFNHGFNRTVVEALAADKQETTWQSLRALTGNTDADAETLAKHSLIREIESQYFDHNALDWNREVTLSPQGDVIVEVSRKRLPEVLPKSWRIVDESQPKTVKVAIEADCATLIADKRECEVGAAGQVPTGFDPGKVYPSRNHPRGVQLGVYSATDALGSMGIDWSVIEKTVNPDQISVYNGSCLSQLDMAGNGGLFARHKGKRVSSKNVPLGLAEMPADFLNAYILGTVGNTGLVMGACATFHYNMRAALQDLATGKTKVAVVGGAESGISAEVIDGFYTMGALGTKKGLMDLDGTDTPDYRRACRPFGANCGFTIAESAQTVIVMADDLAMELGAQIYGSVADVFVSADGFKKSISGPGIGNHVTVAKSAALVKALLGEDVLRNHSFVHAHGTGTPQNRVTESQIFSQVAGAFGIENWPVAAIKCYLGHTLATAGGDQLVSALGTWNSGIVPGITTIDEVAEDVHTAGLSFSNQHREFDAGHHKACLLNAKGFGGNNATSVLLSPESTEQLLLNKYGAAALTQWRHAMATAEKAANDYDQSALTGDHGIVYKFDHNVRDESHVAITDSSLRVEGYPNAIDLTPESQILQHK